MLSRRALFTWDLPPTVPEGHWLHIHRTAMACRFEITLPSELAWGVDAAYRALDEVDRIEAMLSVFMEESEISRLNAHSSSAATASHPYTVSETLYEFLRAAAALAADSEGAFDLASGALARVWGVLAREARVPTSDELALARACSGMQHVRFHAQLCALSFDTPGVTLNAGAMGKGYALDAAANVLRDAGISHALLSAGTSSILALGAGLDGEGWMVSLAGGKQGAGPAVLRLRDEALGTSGNQQQKHLLDPRTGAPAVGMEEAHVIATSAAVADALSTACYVGGETLATRLVQRHPGLEVRLRPDTKAASVVYGRRRRHQEVSREA